MERSFFVYILSSKPHGTLYIGVTNDLVRRVHEHKIGLVDGFTKKYNVKELVYFETYNTAEEAIHREKRMKRWKRDWKKELIEKDNPHWDDLYGTIVR